MSFIALVVKKKAGGTLKGRGGINKFHVPKRGAYLKRGLNRGSKVLVDFDNEINYAMSRSQTAGLAAMF